MMKLFAGILEQVFSIHHPCLAHLRIAKGWLGDDEVRKIASKFLYEVKHVHAGCLSIRKNQEVAKKKE